MSGVVTLGETMALMAATTTDSLLDATDVSKTYGVVAALRLHFPACS